jgi:hypothetical protein
MRTTIGSLALATLCAASGSAWAQADPLGVQMGSGNSHIADTTGTPQIFHTAETVVGPTFMSDPAAGIDVLRSLGFNSVRPAWGCNDDAQGVCSIPVLDDSRLFEFVAAAFAQNMLVFMKPNVGSDGGGPEEIAWLNEYQTELNALQGHIVLDLSLESDCDPSNDPDCRDRFVAQNQTLVSTVRANGFDGVLEVGTTHNGRMVRDTFNLVPQIIASDPLGKVVANWQAYWDIDPEDPHETWYQFDNGYDSGEQGTIEAIDDCAAADFQVRIGLDFVDPYAGYASNWTPAIFEEIVAHDLDTNWWVTGPDTDGNGLLDDPFDANSLTDVGQQVAPYFQAYLGTDPVLD